MNLAQGSLDINGYFTHLKILWDELKNYQPVPECSCGGMKSWTNHLEQEYVIQFLMGLNDSYAGIRAQILMLDPLPNVPRVFNLIIQEERQRTIKSQLTTTAEPLAFSMVTSSSLTNGLAAVTAGGGRGWREQPICSHCGLLRRQVHKCYKHHGFPPGYHARPRPPGPHKAIRPRENLQAERFPTSTYHSCYDNHFLCNFIWWNFHY